MTGYVKMIHYKESKSTRPTYDSGIVSLYMWELFKKTVHILIYTH